MNFSEYKPMVFKAMLMAMTVIIAILCPPGYCLMEPEQGYVLMIEQSPPDAGYVTPGVGVHEIGLNETATLKAIPKAGYRFVYWLGDVADPTVNLTTIFVGAPKLVIAVYERNEYEFLAASEAVEPGTAIGGLMANRYPVRMGPAVRAPRFPEPWEYPPMPEPFRNDRELPVPDVGDDKFPVPVPEPTSIIMLSLGGVSLFLRKRRRNSDNNTRPLSMKK